MRIPSICAVVVLVGCAGGPVGGGAVGAAMPEPPGAAPTGNPDPVANPTMPPPAGSRCVVGPTAHDIDCAHQSSTIGGRSVLWQVPLGTAPAGGWPLAIIYQGSILRPDGPSILAPHGMWQVTADDALLDGVFSDYVINQLTTQTTVIKRLLDNGYAVITPTADNTGFAWDTNLPPWMYFWAPAPDSRFLGALYDAIDAGALGPLSATRWYATGVSSGGYMTSRMAVSYSGRFRALVIAAGSYATCGGGLPCLVPPLPGDHPPTLFLQGGVDPLVPVWQMQAYYDALIRAGFETQAIIDPNESHGWIPASPDQILAWFTAH
jgi:dienelactone hydrolase